MAMVNVDFSFESKYGKYADSIWYDDASPMTEAELEAEKQRRFDNWIAVIEAPRPEVTSAEELLLRDMING